MSQEYADSDDLDEHRDRIRKLLDEDRELLDELDT